MEERIADAWADILPDSHREALYDALCILSDDFFGESEYSELLLLSYLPPRYIPRYDGLFCRRFFVTFLTVGYKLAQPAPSELSCTAEVLACQALISEAESILEFKGIEPDFGDFTDAVFQDLDHEYLFGGSLDGIEDTDIGARLGIGHLHFDEWFEPFLNATTPVHPYAVDDVN